MGKKPLSKVFLKEVRTLCDAYQPPAGYAKVAEERSSDWRDYFALEVSNESNKILFEFLPGGDFGQRKTHWRVEGHVTFMTPNGECTFDRLGVEDSFYLDWNCTSAAKPFRVIVNDGKTPAVRARTLARFETRAEAEKFMRDKNQEMLKIYLPIGLSDESARGLTLDDVVNRQLERISERLKYYETAITVPSIGFTISPDGKKKYEEMLKSGKSVQFMPAGFGVGYNLSTRQLRFSTPNSELAKFFGVPKIWVSRLDCD